MVNCAKSSRVDVVHGGHLGVSGLASAKKKWKFSHIKDIEASVARTYTHESVVLAWWKCGDGP